MKKSYAIGFILLAVVLLILLFISFPQKDEELQERGTLVHRVDVNSALECAKGTFHIYERMWNFYG